MSLSLAAAAAEHPSRIALLCDGVEHTYQSLAQRAARIVAELRARGIDGRDESVRVAIVASARVETVLVIHALGDLGVPIVMVHPRLTVAERQQLLHTVQPALLVDESWREPSTNEDPIPVAAPAISDERCLAIVFTGGTTGIPKGALLSRRAFIAAARASQENLGWREDDRWLLCMPLAHVGGLSILIRCLLARRCVVLSSRSSFDPLTVSTMIARDRVTLVSLVPTMLKKLLDLDSSWHPPPHLRAILLGGAASSPSLIERAATLRLPVLTTYGLTEACSQVTTQRYGTPCAVGEGAGPPVSGMEVRIVDQQIQLRGPSLMDGYFPKGAHADPFLPDGWMATGDLGHFDEAGALHIVSRRTDLIVTGGENVYPLEVEQLLERHPQIAAACVVGLPDETWGEIVAALLVPSGTPPSQSALHEWLLPRLAPHQRPRRFAFVDELPLTAAGKIDRAAARRAWA